MFRIKICGITNVDDARAAADGGADAVGFNFFSKSRRFVEPETARQVALALPPGIKRVGVFVNHDAPEIIAIKSFVGLDAIQLHGAERAEQLANLPADAILVRAYRCGGDGLAPLAHYLDGCRAAGRSPDAVLIDADAGSEFGGTGRAADWTRITHERAMLGGLPLILAGGLTPANVAAAIQAVRPAGVDVATGVECLPGIKDRELMMRFIEAARQGFSAAATT
jgi:phosphoribosylanthranilate isomerase